MYLHFECKFLRDLGNRFQSIIPFMFEPGDTIPSRVSKTQIPATSWGWDLTVRTLSHRAERLPVDRYHFALAEAILQYA